MLKPETTAVDLEALTAYVVANPDDFAGWSAYSDGCRDLCHDAWADLALKFRDADPDGRAMLIGEHWQSWPPAHGLAMQATGNALEGIARAGRELFEALAAVGAGVARAMAPTIEALGRISRGEQPTPPAITD
jgi:hypothetical protein